MTSLLRLEAIRLWRGGRLLFDGLDLKLEAGEAIHVKGPNGSGKSSLIRLAAGLLRPQSGRVAASSLALADDKLAFDGELELERALGFWTQVRGAAPPGDALAELGLTALRNVPVRLLSAGQAKRAMLARVLASGARLWLLDEPLNGLDSDSAARLGRAIAAHRASGGAILAASHAPLGGEWASLEIGR